MSASFILFPKTFGGDVFKEGLSYFRWELHPGPQAYKACALTTELRKPIIEFTRPAFPGELCDRPDTQTLVGTHTRVQAICCNGCKSTRHTLLNASRWCHSHTLVCA